MAYIDFQYYSDTFLGNTIGISEFAQFAARASSKIDELTFDRVAAIVDAGTDTDTIDQIKMATCAVADELYAQKDVSIRGRVKSESVGRVSITYGIEPGDSLIGRLKRVAKVYLGQSGLMFPGFYDDEV